MTLRKLLYTLISHLRSQIFPQLAQFLINIMSYNVDSNAFYYQQCLDYHRTRIGYGDTPRVSQINWLYRPDFTTEPFARNAPEQIKEDHDLEEFNYDSIPRDGQ